MHRHITKDNRACIAALLRKGYSYNEIAEVLDVHRTTIGREVRRNCTACGIYDVWSANKHAVKRRKESKMKYRLIDTTPLLKRRVVYYLQKDWSPQQIDHRLDVASTSSIYRYVTRTPYLKLYLRRKGKKRRRYGTKRIPSRYQANKRSIHERPIITTIGHWEGDTIVGSERRVRIVTYVDKVSGYLVATKATGKADDIQQQAERQFRRLPCRSITYDNGSEFALHQLIERDTGALVYFADPGAPHQRGTNENTNGLLRQYFPKGSLFASITSSDVRRVVRKLNNRPRKRLNYLTPREFLEKEGVRFR
jgi:transposase, IS30 family